VSTQQNCIQYIDSFSTSSVKASHISWLLRFP